MELRRSRNSRNIKTLKFGGMTFRLLTSCLKTFYLPRRV